MRCKGMAPKEYDQSGMDAFPSEWRPSQRSIAWIAASGSAGFQLLTCDRTSKHAMSAKNERVSEQLSDKRRSSARRPKVGILRRDGAQEKEKRAQTIRVGIRSRVAQFLH